MLEQAIARNRARQQKFSKYLRIQKAMILKVFEHQDTGKQAKHDRIMAKIAVILKPMYDAHQEGYRHRLKLGSQRLVKWS